MYKEHLEQASSFRAAHARHRNETQLNQRFLEAVSGVFSQVHRSYDPFGSSENRAENCRKLGSLVDTLLDQ